MSFKEKVEALDFEAFDGVVLIGAGKDGRLTILAEPDNVMVAQYLITRAQFELNVFAAPKDPFVETKEE